MELLEALQILYKGQSNIAVMAKSLDLPLETLQEEFRQYVKDNPKTAKNEAWVGGKAPKKKAIKKTPTKKAVKKAVKKRTPKKSGK